jgi:hypothetical protein
MIHSTTIYKLCYSFFKRDYTLNFSCVAFPLRLCPLQAPAFQPAEPHTLDPALRVCAHRTLRTRTAAHSANVADQCHPTVTTPGLCMLTGIPLSHFTVPCLANTSFTGGVLKDKRLRRSQDSYEEDGGGCDESCSCRVVMGNCSLEASDWSSSEDDGLEGACMKGSPRVERD